MRRRYSPWVVIPRVHCARRRQLTGKAVREAIELVALGVAAVYGHEAPTDDDQCIAIRIVESELRTKREREMYGPRPQLSPKGTP